jgi:hypothetical protein
MKYLVGERGREGEVVMDKNASHICKKPKKFKKNADNNNLSFFLSLTNVSRGIGAM